MNQPGLLFNSLAIFLAVGTLIFNVVPAAAFPGVPYNGSAESQGIDLSLDVIAGNLASSASLDVGFSHGSLNGATSTPVTTSGEAFSARISATSGSFLGLDAGANVVTSTKTLGDSLPNPVTDNAGANISLGLPGTLSIDAPAGSTQTNSELLPDDVNPTTMGTTAQSLLTSVDVSLVIPLMTAEAITLTAAMDTTAAEPNHDVLSTASAHLAGVTLDLAALNLGLTQVITATVITATATTTSDGVSGGETATAAVGFVELFVAGTDMTLSPPGTTITLTSGLASGRVTIGPVLNTVAQPTTSTAEAVALRVEMLTDALGLANETVIDLGIARPSAFARSGNTGPTVIELKDFGAQSQITVLYFPGFGLFAGYVLVYWILRRRFIRKI